MKITCCNMGRTYLEYLEKRDIYILQPPKENWWVVVDYCPWCGIMLRTAANTAKMESY